MMKDGKKYVTSKVRQSAGARRQHTQQWARRAATDRAVKKRESALSTSKEGSKKKASLLDVADEGPNVLLEKASSASLQRRRRCEGYH